MVTRSDSHVVEIEGEAKGNLVSKSILQTALTNKTLRLELTYQAPSMLREEDDTAMKPVTHAGLEHPDSVQAIAGEFAGLMSVI
jgi:hypothetical protein